MKALYFYDRYESPFVDIGKSADEFATEWTTDALRAILGEDQFDYEVTYDCPFGRRRDYDILFFDYGGIGQFAPGMLGSMARYFVKDALNNPSKYYVLNSSFTKYAVDEVIEDFGGDPPANLFFSPEDFCEFLKKQNGKKC